MEKTKLKKILEKIYEFLKKGLKVFALVLLISFIGQKLGFIESYDANAQFADTLTSTEAETIPKMIIAFENLLNRLLWPILLFIGGLLDNSILFGSGMEERMREIWIPIRNLVNIIFVVALVGIALYNVTGLADDGGNASLKTALPKLLLGIVLINFSFLGIKVFLDVINVGTVAIMSMPDQVSEGLAEIDVANDEDAVKRICLAMAGKNMSDAEAKSEELFKADMRLNIAREVGLTYSANVKGKTYEEIKNELLSTNKITNGADFDSYVDTIEEQKMCDGFTFTTTGTAFFSNYSQSNAALALAVNMGEIMYYQDLRADIDTVEGMLTSTLFSLLLYIIYAASFLALFVVLLARLVVLWLSIVLSPVLMIAIFVPQIKEKIEVFGSISDKFIKHAIAPIGISLSMTIGWIMLKTMKYSASIGSVGTPLQEILGGPDGALPVVGLSTLQDFIVGIGTVAVVWLGVFSSASDTIASGLTESMRGGLLNVGKWIAKKPLDLNLIPIHVKEDDNDPNKLNRYSVNETLGALGNMFRPTANDRLTRDLTGMKQYVASDLRSAESVDRIARVVVNANSSAKEIKAEIGRLRETNGPLFNEFRTTNENIRRTVDALLKATNDEEIENAAKDLKIEVKNASELNSSPESASK